MSALIEWQLHALLLICCLCKHNSKHAERIDWGKGMLQRQPQPSCCSSSAAGFLSASPAAGLAVEDGLIWRPAARVPEQGEWLASPTLQDVLHVQVSDAAGGEVSESMQQACWAGRGAAVTLGMQNV